MLLEQKLIKKKAVAKNEKRAPALTLTLSEIASCNLMIRFIKHSIATIPLSHRNYTITE